MSSPPNLNRLRQKNRRLESSHQEVEHEDDGDGNWLISYADLMTLLVGFFVMLMSFSTPDAAKIEKLKQETSKQMDTKYDRPYQKISDALVSKLKDLGLGKEVSVFETAEGVTLVSNGTLFFDSGSAKLRDEAQNLMSAISNIIVEKAKGFRVIVEGHTDSVPMLSDQFPSNWELSSARAGSVVRLLEGRGIARHDLRAAGLADTEPVTTKPEEMAKNRRIVIHINKVTGTNEEKTTNVRLEELKSAPNPKQ